MWLIIPVAERPFKMPALPITWLALVWLGVLGSGLALVLWLAQLALLQLLCRHE